MDLQSPRPTTTVRRNPPRRAKQTPSTNALDPSTSSSTASAALAVAGITPFPLHEILQPGPTQIPPPAPKPPEQNADSSENLKVFLRIRPLEISLRPSKNTAGGGARYRGKGASPKGGKSKNKVCLVVNDSSSVTLSAPNSLLDSKRAKSEVYDGFSFVFSQDSHQKEIYERVVDPLVMDFMEGKSALLAAMGPTGSGKTHTMFGCPKEPGMVPLALQKIFCHATCNGELHPSRLYYLSMFEIYSERGKGERIFDLLPDGADLSLQLSVIKGLQEVMVSNVAEAESLIARGMLKRATAATNANNQSSRSQCIINIRCALGSTDAVDAVPANSAVLTIADLAGAERERKTGNQGARLLESSFINNTSMVFGLCLRSLLEHQKNPKKPFQKHFQNSLLTRYLKDYMEGKKRMTLILTVKSGEEDYLDTSFLLRQASPYMKIKFSNHEEFPNAPCRKRTTTSLIKLEHLKRKKYNDSEALSADGGKGYREAVNKPRVSEKEVTSTKLQETEPPKCSNASPNSLIAVHSGIQNKEDDSVELQRMTRNDEIMRNFSRALWSVLKQFKQKLEISENEVQNLKETLKKKSAQIMELEGELKELRCSNSCHKQYSKEFFSSEVNACALGPPLPSANRNNLRNTDADVDDSCTPVLVCQSPEISIVTEDNRLVEDPGIEGILLASNLTGDGESTLNSVVKQSTLSMEGKKMGNSAVMDFCLSMQSHQLIGQIPESFSGTKHADEDLVALTDSGVTNISSDLDSIETGHKDSKSLVRSLVLDDKTMSCSSVEKLTLLMEEKEVIDQNCNGFPSKDHVNELLEMTNNFGIRDMSSTTRLTGSTHSDPPISYLQSRVMADVKNSSNEHGTLLVEKKACLSQVEISDTGYSSLSVNDVKRQNLPMSGCFQESVQNHELLKEINDTQLEFPCSASFSDMQSYSSAQSQTPDQVEDNKGILPLPGNQGASLRKEKKQSDSHLSLIQDVRQNGKSQVENPPKKEKHDTAKLSNAEKPKRRLLPASAMLLKEFSGLDMEVENPKETRGKLTAEVGRSQGSTELVRLLKSNLHL